MQLRLVILAQSVNKCNWIQDGIFVNYRMRRFLLSVLFMSAPFIGFAQQDTTAGHPDGKTTADSTLAVGTGDSVPTVLPYVAYQDTGIASWYGHKWEGRLTASGEYFSPDSMTAAHKWLPFGTIVRVTNLDNDSVVYVRITDRLPKSSKRSIDLSPVAAKRLGFYTKGLQKVAITSVGMTEVHKKRRSTGPVLAEHRR